MTGKEFALVVIVFVLFSTFVTYITSPDCGHGSVRTLDRGGWHCEIDPPWWRLRL